MVRQVRMVGSSLVLLAALLTTTGCGPEPGDMGRGDQGRPLDDQPVDVVMGRVNDNATRMNFLLRGKNVSARGRWDNEAFDLTGGTLLFRRSRDLYLKLEHTLSRAIEVGSNEQEFWVWKRLGDERYWWGLYSQMDNVDETAIPILPEHLLDVIGLQPLPNEPGRQPLFSVGPETYELIYSGRDADGRPYPSRTISIDRREPFLICGIVYFHPDGHPIITAALSDYRPIDGSPVMAARHVEMRWLNQESWLELNVGRMENGGEVTAAVAKRFVSPLRQGRNVGRIERVDRPAEPASDPADDPKQ